MSEELALEFIETRKITKYNHMLETKVYTEEDLNKLNNDKILNLDTSVIVTKTDTISEILKSTRYTAALNFADAYDPGGCVIDGASTQEESLCRSSNLYESLILPECIDKYYRYNKSKREFTNGKASDRIIYTRNVVFFRDSDLSWLLDNEVRQCDIITCPAPLVTTATDEEVKRRMENIIKVADDNRVTTLILGAWGCGAFGNDWDHFSELWMQVIKNINTNCNIVFALRDREMNPDILWGKDWWY